MAEVKRHKRNIDSTMELISKTTFGGGGGDRPPKKPKKDGGLVGHYIDANAYGLLPQHIQRLTPAERFFIITRTSEQYKFGSRDITRAINIARHRMGQPLIFNYQVVGVIYDYQNANPALPVLLPQFQGGTPNTAVVAVEQPHFQGGTPNTPMSAEEQPHFQSETATDDAS